MTENRENMEVVRLMRSIASALIIYFSLVGILYACGYVFDISWLQWQKTVYDQAGGVKTVTGSVIPFFFVHQFFMSFQKKHRDSLKIKNPRVLLVSLRLGAFFIRLGHAVLFIQLFYFSNQFFHHFLLFRIRFVPMLD